MKAIVWLMAVIVGLYAVGCSVPDDPGFTALKQAMEQLPPGKRYEFWRWTVAREAEEWLKTKGPDDALFHLECEDRPNSRGVTVLEILECLRASEHNDFWWCVDTFFDDDPSYGDSRCKRKIHDEFIGEIPEYWADPADSGIPEDEYRSVLSAHAVIELLKSTAPPIWYLALIAAAGTAAGFPIALTLPRLCALAGPAHWSCPSSPSYPPGQTPQPGGDK